MKLQVLKYWYLGESFLEHSVKKSYSNSVWRIFEKLFGRNKLPFFQLVSGLFEEGVHKARHGNKK